jgi:lauroyl/myristoyl acyltransferase
MWNKSRYLDKLHATASMIDGKFEGFADNESAFYHQFLLCSANKNNLLPDSAAYNDRSFYRDVLLHRELAVSDNREKGLPIHTEGNMDFINDLHRQPRIFCTYHLGSYRLICHYLCQVKAHFSIVMDAQTMEQQGPEFREVFENNETYSEASFRIINAESPSAGLQMLREIKSGRSLLFYADGNSGVGGMGRNDDKLTQIHFFNKRMFARKGIAFISHVAGVPLIPALSYRNEEMENIITFFDPVIPNRAEDREVFVSRVTQQLYDRFTQYLLRYPQQWEGWFYVHRFFDLSIFSDTATVHPVAAEALANELVQVNEERYGIYEQENKYFLFDKKTYSTFSISGQLRNLLRETRRKTIYFRDILSHRIIHDLIEKNVLVIK